ncbi:MAG: hypothetical protein M1114_04095 [Candidatus Dependentiae bacterium]|nr:hypothetical protein [Candidatus Dependentiae bacterium]
MNILKIIAFSFVASGLMSIASMDQQNKDEQSLLIPKIDFYSLLENDICHSRVESFKRIVGLAGEVDKAKLQGLKDYSQQLQRTYNDQLKELRPFSIHNRRLFCLDTASTVSLVAMAITLPIGLATNDSASFYVGAASLGSAICCLAMRVKVTNDGYESTVRAGAQGEIQRTIDDLLQDQPADENV